LTSYSFKLLSKNVLSLLYSLAEQLDLQAQCGINGLSDLKECIDAGAGLSDVFILGELF
jgi:hypothetical protein